MRLVELLLQFSAGNSVALLVPLRSVQFSSVQAQFRRRVGKFMVTHPLGLMMFEPDCAQRGQKHRHLAPLAHAQTPPRRSSGNCLSLAALAWVRSGSRISDEWVQWHHALAAVATRHVHIACTPPQNLFLYQPLDTRATRERSFNDLTGSPHRGCACYV